MTHEYYIINTTRNVSTGLISKINFKLKSISGELSHTGKYVCNILGSVEDAGFIAYDLLTSSDLIGFLDKYGDQETPNNGLTLYQSINASSLSETPTTVNDLPPNVTSDKITV